MKTSHMLRFILLFAAGLLPAAAGAQTDPADETFPASDILYGKSILEDECRAIEHAVWVSHAEGTECIRYFPSSGLKDARQAVLFFHGDRMNQRTLIDSAYRDNSVRAQMKLAEENFRRSGVPFVMVGRPGVYGSSGVHARRRLPKEFHSLNAAVDAIKEKFHLEKVILAGQSGGASVVAALLTLGRTDVKCAIGTSGNYDVLRLAEIKRYQLNQQSRPGVDVTGYAYPYNIIDHVDGIAADPQRRIFIIGDPGDENTVFELQKAFADKVAVAGHAVELIQAQAKGSEKHSLYHVAYPVAGWCARDESTDAIKTKIERLGKGAPLKGAD